MRRVRSALRRVRLLPGIPLARQAAELAVTPTVRGDLAFVSHDLGHRVDHLERVSHATEVRATDVAAAVAEASSRLDTLAAAVEALSGTVSTLVSDVQRLDEQQPLVLNAIASTNGTARLLRRELDSIRDAVGGGLGETLAARVDRLDLAAATEPARLSEAIGPHLDTLAWLVGRVETVRAEMLHELRYTKHPTTETVTEIINEAALHPADGDIRLNLGCGHITLDGFANVDTRELPGVDIVARADDLPIPPNSAAEIFSAHMLEHFPLEQLRRTLLPYWYGLLRSGGTIRAVVPDVDGMVRQYVAGTITFEQLRNVTYGGQEYDGDFHYNGFTTDSLAQLFAEAGFTEIEVLASGRPNGDCLELEMRARKPQS